MIFFMSREINACLQGVMITIICFCAAYLCKVCSLFGFLVACFGKVFGMLTCRCCPFKVIALFIPFL